MHPPSGTTTGRRIAVLALIVGVLGGGLYGASSWRAQLGEVPDLCIRSYGPFHQLEREEFARDSMSVFPDGTRFLKVTDEDTVSLFTVNAQAVIEKASDIPGAYPSAAVVALDDTRAAIVYQDVSQTGRAAYIRRVTFGAGAPTVDAPIKIADIPGGFEPYVRFALDVLVPGQFVIVTNIPDANGSKTLRAMVASFNGTTDTLRPLGAFAAPPDETPEAIMDFDVATIDLPFNTTTFVVAFRGRTGAKFIRGSLGGAGVVFDPAYLRSISQTATNMDLASSFSRPKKAALAYRDNGHAYAGEIVLATASNDFVDRFTPIRISLDGDVVLSTGVTWVSDQFYLAAIGVEGETTDARRGTYVRRGKAGTSLFGSELRVTNATQPDSLLLAGIKGPPGRVVISQRSEVDGETGLKASYCTGCVGGLSDLGEQCIPTTGVPGDNGFDPLCDPRFCGNAQMEPGEQCDPADPLIGERCDPLCRLMCEDDDDCPSGECAGGICTNLCGNGTVEPPICVEEGGVPCPPPSSNGVTAVNLPAGVFPIQHFPVDVNGDGKLDVAVANYIGDGSQDANGFYAGTIDVMLGNGNGTFQAKRTVGTFSWNDGGGQRGLDILDVDQDGDADIVVHTYPNVYLLTNNNMTFARSLLFQNLHTTYIHHGDLNDDGDPDLVMSGYRFNPGQPTSSDRIFLSYGQTGTSFSAPQGAFSDLASGYDTIRIADFNGDGTMDVIGSQYLNDGYAIKLYENGPSGGSIELFRRQQNPNVRRLIVTDLTRDGHLDVVIEENSPYTVALINDGDGRIARSTVIQNSISSYLTAVADPNKDGNPDIVLGANQGTEGAQKRLWYAAGNGNGGFATPLPFMTWDAPPTTHVYPSSQYIYPWVFYANDLKAADYNGDGRMDLSMPHASYSDSVSVFFFNDVEIEPCVEIPPVIVCSQIEECDDGADNGQPGKCTRQCVFCGNGVIDTVNGLDEECDEGAENGVEGSGCSLRCKRIEDPPQHLGCVGVGQCALVEGEGPNDCTAATAATDCCDPLDPTCKHMACVGVGSCSEVQGPGNDDCSAGPDCCDPLDPSCTTNSCDPLTDTCEEVDGPGIPQCVVTPNNCPATHLVCQNEACVPVAGDGTNECTSSAQCFPCVNNNICEEGESCRCGDCAGAARCDQCDGDPVCDDDESCLCGDCAGHYRCTGGTKCEEDANGAKRCVADIGGTVKCTGDGDCTRTQHLECVNMACAVVQGPGADKCDTVGQTCNPTHRECNFLYQTCVFNPNPGIDRCSNSSDPRCQKHFACDDNLCVLKDGPGPSTCAGHAACIDVTPKHLACIGIGSCAVVDGAGPDECGMGADCCDATDPFCSHSACVNGACADVPGPGPQMCDADADCAPCSASDPNCHSRCDVFVPACLAVPDPGEQCAATGDCGHLACENSQCVVKPGAGPNTCDGPEDCTERLGCVGVGQCALVPQGSTAPACIGAVDCCDPLDPACSHSACASGDCVSVPGPGPQVCSADADCAPCPASNPNCHQQCDALAEQCVGAPLGSCPVSCEEPKHLACVNQQCTQVDGAGPDTCGSSNDCVGTCGNGSPDPGEQCDQGPGNRTQPPSELSEWYCKALSCTISSCFDSGDNDGDSFPDDLDPGCWSYNRDDVAGGGSNRGLLGFLLAQIQPETPMKALVPIDFLQGKDDEACPDWTVDRGERCLLACEAGDICPDGTMCREDGTCPPVCGNQIIDLGLGEECDDGNLDNADACLNNCRLPECEGGDCPRCGDGIHHPTLGEQCDGSQPASVGAGKCTANCRIRCDDDADCPGKCDVEVGLCLPAVCGDGETNQAWERCDDGNIDNLDQCNNACQPTCKGDADCESGKCDVPRQVCTPLCGNERVDPGEGCDDGNFITNDACTNECQLHCTDDATCDCDEEKQQCRPMCGNGRTDPGEGCDDGNREDRDQCSNRCQVRCRPGTVCPDQQACPQNGVCPLPGFCGDGVLNDETEQCDDGNSIETDNCTTQCRARCSQNLECPNGLICAGEECTECSNSLQCDSGFCVDGRCRQALPICGNGVVEPGEVCDDANGDEADGCTSNCFFPVNHACVASAQCQTKLCEDGVCNRCADASQCVPEGLRCTEGNCLFGGLQCGDGVVQAGEACDDANFNEQDQCTSACLLPFGEACSHALQCASTICSGGECTACRADAECASGTRCAIGLCLTDAQMALIPNICGNGLLEAEEECDDGNNAYGDGCTPACYEGNTPSRIEVAANMTVQMPFGAGVNGGATAGEGYDPNDPRLHAGAGDLSDTGPATIAIMAAGAAGGAAWVRRRWKKR